MAYMIVVLIQCLFLKIVAIFFFWPDLVPQSGIVQIDCNLSLEYIVIYDCGFNVYFFKFSLKILLHLSPKIAIIVSCQIFCFPQCVF